MIIEREMLVFNVPILQLKLFLGEFIMHKFLLILWITFISTFLFGHALLAFTAFLNIHILLENTSL